MIDRILLPTDGSTLSNVAIAPAVAIARAQHALVILIRIIEPILWPAYGFGGYINGEVHQETLDAIESDAAALLEQMRLRLHAKGVQVETQLLHGSAGAALLDIEREVQPSLVVLASHGRTGLARFAHGSVADAMVREGVAPVFMVHAFGPPSIRFESALVPLDGSPLAEAALPMVETLAGKPLQYARLLRAVATPGEADEAYNYLERIRARLALSVQHVQTTVEVKPPAEAIAQAAAPTDFIILSTHGRGGLDRLRHGSVAERVTRLVPTPSLLVRAGKASTADAPTPAAAASS